MNTFASKRKRHGTGPPELSRRRFFHLGAMGMMLNLPQLLWARSPYGPAAPIPRSDTSCIFIIQQGGPSPIDTWDLKPTAPEETRGPYKPIATSVPGLQVCELMPRLAKLADRLCLIRSMTHQHTAHPSAIHALLSGQSTPPADAPYFGSVVSKVRPSSRNIPSYVWLQDMSDDSGPRYHTGGF